MTHNINLSVLSRLVLNKFVATGSVYGVNCVAMSINTIKNCIWTTFAGHALQLL